MQPWKELTPAEFSAHSFTLYDKDWALLTVEAAGRVNAMTISWGGLGTLWSSPMATVYVRQNRYTYGLMEEADTFSLSFLPGQYRDKLQYLGTVSGRDEDKIAGSGLTLVHEGGAPAFAEAGLVLVCKKLYAQLMEPGCFTDDSIMGRHYGKDPSLHKIYMGRVERIFSDQ